MEKQLARIVNRGLAGEPENIVFQVIDTLKIFEFSQITKIDNNGNVSEVSLLDDNLNQNEIQYVLHNLGHECMVSFDENDKVTLYF